MVAVSSRLNWQWIFIILKVCAEAVSTITNKKQSPASRSNRINFFGLKQGQGDDGILFLSGNNWCGVKVSISKSVQSFADFGSKTCFNTKIKL